MHNSSATVEPAVDARPVRRGPFVLIALWLVILLAAFAGLEAYKATPGTTGQTPDQIAPETLGTWGEGLPRLLLFVHPRCPCSNASLTELAAIIERNPNRVAAEVVFVKPHGAGQRWERSPLWDQATKIRDVRVVVDDGSLAGRLGAQTSGYVVLYDANGRLLFNGGITRSRGHEGENAGSRAICALLSAEIPADRQTPVFGCPLFSPGNCDQANCQRVVERSENR